MFRALIALSLATVDCLICLALGLPAMVAGTVAALAFVIATVAMSVVSSSEEDEAHTGRASFTDPEVFRAPAESA